MSLTDWEVHIVNDSTYNSMLLETLLCGSYTVLFGYTLQILLHKGRKKLSASLALLWLVIIVTFSLDWWYHRAAFINHNGSPLDTAGFLLRISPNRVGQSIFIADNIFSVSSNWIADAILVWRCYVLWEDKKWILLPLPILIIAEIVIPCVSYLSAVSNNPRLDIIFLVIFFSISTIITVIGTSLIILRILVVRMKDHSGKRHSVYHNIQRIIVESGLVYSAAMVLASISIFLQLTHHSEKVVYITSQMTQYCNAALTPLSGIAPTLIAARVAHEDSEHVTNLTHAVSHLTFRRSANQTLTTDTNGDYGSQLRLGNMDYTIQQDNPTNGPDISHAHKLVPQHCEEMSSGHDSTEKIV